MSTFSTACTEIREAIYGMMGLSQVAANQVNACNGTGFLIAPDVLATAAHFCHVDNDITKPIHQHFEGIRSPDIGQKMVTATFIAEDTERDLALLRLSKTVSPARVRLNYTRILSGTPCGSLGFPLASVIFSQTGRTFNLVERFQSASISAFVSLTHPSGRTLGHYETDSFMYGGSSGCPGFLEDATVFGMHVASVLEAAGESTQTRTAIAIWVPANDIRDFAAANGVSVGETVTSPELQAAV